MKAKTGDRQTVAVQTERVDVAVQIERVDFPKLAS